MTLFPTPPPVRYAQQIEPLPEGDLDLSALIPGEGPLELDIGYGRGRSLLERAAQRPDVRVLGIEIKPKWAFMVEQRRKKRGLTNARALHGDARALLARVPHEACLQRVFVHFPDPWWKKRHGKRRVVGEGLLEILARLIAPGGELYVQTDVEERADEYEALVAAHPAFTTSRLPANPYGARSNREVRAEEDGIPVHRVLAVRVLAVPVHAGDPGA